MLRLCALALCLVVECAAAAPQNPESVAIQLRTKASAGDSVAYSWLTELTTRIGPRPAGSANETLAAQWAAQKFQSLGFENVRIETFPISAWVRGSERGEITAPGTQRLAVAALGGSPATANSGVEGEVVIFSTLEDLAAAPAHLLDGKIAMIDRRMVRVEDSSGYGDVAAVRAKGPGAAAAKGAVAFLVRSVGTDEHRLPHTGATAYVDGKVPIPSFALSGPDADQLGRLASMVPGVRVRLFSTASIQSNAHSQNVVAEIKGTQRPEEIILLGAHLDSWDLGTGATDDGAGGAVITAAAKLIRDLPGKPRRTIRVVLFGSEEVAQPIAPFSVFGGHAYLEKHRAELGEHVLAAESDMGADRVYALRLPKGIAGDSEWGRSVFRVLSPLGILPTSQTSETGIDIGPTVDAGVPDFALYQDVSLYFDVHHSADDTLDKIDRRQLDQNVAAWAAFVWLASESGPQFRGAAVDQGKDRPGGVRALFNDTKSKH